MTAPPSAAPQDTASAWFADVCQTLHESGLNVTQEFAVSEAVRALFPFPSFGRDSSLALLIGNTKALWPHFTAWLRAEPSCPAAPLDSYVERRISAALRAPGVPVTACYFSSVMNYPLGEQRVGPVPMQKLAALSGLAALSPVHLNVHPEYGPWLSLRAVVVFDAPPGASPRPQLKPCEGCSAPCEVPFRAALSQLGADRKLSIRQDWRQWLRVRQTCPVGQAHEFDATQSEYHYLHSAEILKKIRF